MPCFILSSDEAHSRSWTGDKLDVLSQAVEGRSAPCPMGLQHAPWRPREAGHPHPHRHDCAT